MLAENSNLKYNPLVSIIIITYNSAKFVRETLESVKAQTYSNIELLVSDDCSKDETVEICRVWLEKNKDRFVRTNIIESQINTGIAPNCNRGFKEANGEWLKLIAGDDALELNIIEDYIAAVAVNKDIKCIYSNVKIYDNYFKEENLLPNTPMHTNIFNLEATTAKDQFEILLRSNKVWASTIMVKKTALESIGLYNEKYPFFEDRPFLLALVKKGYKIYYLDVFGAKYRRHNHSVQARSNIYLSRFKEDQQRFFIQEYIKQYTLKEQREMKFNYKKSLFLKNLFNNRTNIIVKVLNRVLNIIPTSSFKQK